MGETHNIVGQEHALGALGRIFRNRRIPSALLFTGIPGIGKQTAARIFARACNCLNNTSDAIPDPSGKIGDISAQTLPCCGHCRPCRKIETGIYPDLLQVKPEKSEIMIGQIRELCRTVAMKPYEARLRVVIISEADRMNPSAGNALLKILEEPPDNTLLILTARQSLDILPTLASRCQELRFRPLLPEEITDILTRGHGVDPQSASVIASLSDGSVSRSLQMNQPSWFAWKNWITDILASWATLPTNVRLGFGERLLSAPTRLEQALDLIAAWYRDQLMAKHGHRIFLHADRVPEVLDSSIQKSTADLVSCLYAVQRTQRLRNARGNQRILLDQLMLELV